MAKEQTLTEQLMTQHREVLILHVNPDPQNPSEFIVGMFTKVRDEDSILLPITEEMLGRLRNAQQPDSNKISKTTISSQTNNNKGSQNCKSNTNKSSAQTGETAPYHAN